ncbi:hypothetical protein [Pelagicoccus mobilis]|uniref:Alpha-L-rhamnosidase six-hairpin glycosidase domain-containing protein n=1 Tax=Pelagicoccus mobilis TaxID=415221 RepID=A0A934VRX6_9BACT|nr:hypothetical protein [Pelagicoccus mobilis]MBK1879862.1 hypothetical protein [Pelagicoccus mobilis]
MLIRRRITLSLVAFSTAVASVFANGGADWLKAETQRQLEGCRVESSSGVWLHTPDGIAHYHALWTRDNYYFYKYAGDLMKPIEVKRSIQYILDGQREDGCIPDRVNADGTPIYSPGGDNNPLADHAKDNGPFVALLAVEYTKRTGDFDYFKGIAPQLKRGLDFIERAPNGLVYNPPENPQCVYGFTDIVAKTGHVLFTSLIYYQACVEMAELGEQVGYSERHELLRRAELIRNSISSLWNDEAGMFNAADRDCQQVDIWGSFYAITVGLATEAQTDRILDYFLGNRAELVQRGQVRHLAPGDAWQRFFAQVPKPATEPGKYQNGAYWATPLAWIVPIIDRVDPQLASSLVADTVRDFRAEGVAECVNGDYRKVPDYVPSITNLYAVRHWIAE